MGSQSAEASRGGVMVLPQGGWGVVDAPSHPPIAIDRVATSRTSSTVIVTVRPRVGRWPMTRVTRGDGSPFEQSDGEFDARSTH